jgi:hypothetical protein
MIYCIWYPSGGFGHFVNSILSLYGDNFERPDNKNIEFSKTGDSHSLKLVAPKYFSDTPYPEFTFDSTKNYSVLIDNGINNTDKLFLKTFADSKVIKLHYDDLSWPVVANTLIVKASKSSIEKELPLDSTWPCQEPWAIREKYSLYLKEHYLRNAWGPDDNHYNLNVQTLLCYQQLKYFFNSFITVSDFKSLHDQWLQHNYKYFYPVIQSVKIVNAIKNLEHFDVSYINDIWDQAVVNYFLNLEFNVEIPVNNYPDWFQNTNQIANIL